MTFEVSLRKKSMLGSKDWEEGKKKKQNEQRSKGMEELVSKA